MNITETPKAEAGARTSLNQMYDCGQQYRIRGRVSQNPELLQLQPGEIALLDIIANLQCNQPLTFMKVHGLTIPLFPEISSTIVYLLLNGAYKTASHKLIAQHVQLGARCLNLGTGIGTVATHLGYISGNHVVTVDANSKMEPIAEAISSCNDVSLQFIHGAVAPRARKGTVEFNLASSLWLGNFGNCLQLQCVASPVVDVAELVLAHQIDTLFVDLNGAEMDLFQLVPMPTSLVTVLVEIHNNQLNHFNTIQTLNALWGQGYVLADQEGTTYVWKRAPKVS